MTAKCCQISINKKKNFPCTLFVSHVIEKNIDGSEKYFSDTWMEKGRVVHFFRTFYNFIFSTTLL